MELPASRVLRGRNLTFSGKNPKTSVKGFAQKMKPATASGETRGCNLKGKSFPSNVLPQIIQNSKFNVSKNLNSSWF